MIVMIVMVVMVVMEVMVVMVLVIVMTNNNDLDRLGCGSSYRRAGPLALIQPRLAPSSNEDALPRAPRGLGRCRYMLHYVTLYDMV